MTTLVFIENVLGSGQIVRLTEDFGDHRVTRDLKPGENVRLVVSPYKSLLLEEIVLAAHPASQRERDCANMAEEGPRAFGAA